MTTLKKIILTIIVLSCLVTAVSIAAAQSTREAAAHSGALAGERYRVIVSTDIGGSDPDDHQSMVHLMLYTDVLDFEGLISTQWRGSRKAEILKIIDCYERDYPNLKTHSDRYPTPDELRAITKVGAIGRPGPSGVRTATEGSDWIVQCARRNDPRPLYILIWGGITDLAQSLHDAPDILPKLRVYFIGGPNKDGFVNAYNYIEQNHPTLWIIESNVTYRGWFNGGNQDGEWGNREFITRHVAGHGALGAFLAPILGGRMKMGDTPSLAWLLYGNPADPSQPGWGGKFVRIWDGRKTILNHLPTSKDEQVEVFGVNEFTIPVPEGYSATNTATLVMHNGKKAIGVNENDILRFRFAVRDVRAFTYKIQSDFTGLDGMTGAFSSVPPSIERRSKPSTVHPNWWGDDFDPALYEGKHAGAKTISQWRVDYLRDFAMRMDWCKSPAPTKTDEKP